MTEVQHAANLRARWHGPTESKPSRFVVSWRGQRLMTASTDDLIRAAGQSARSDVELAKQAAEAYRKMRSDLFDGVRVDIQSITIGDAGDCEYSIHVTVKESDA